MWGMGVLAVSETVTFGAVGDIALAMGVADAMQEKGLDWPFARIQEQLDRAELLFGNLECVVIPEDFPRHEIDRKVLIAPFSGTAVASVLGRAGFDFLNLAPISKIQTKI